mgnify:FL=1
MTTSLVLRTSIDRPLTNAEVDGNFTGLQTDISELSTELLTDISELSTELLSTRNTIFDILPLKANLLDPVFTGLVEVPTYDSASTGPYVASLDYVISKFGDISVDMIPSVGASSVIEGGVLVYNGINLGSPSKPFANIWVQSGKFAANTISIGTANISASEAGGVLLPQRTSIGVSSNIIPTNLVSSDLDIRYAQSSSQSALIIDLTADSSIGALSAVGITSTGLVSRVAENFTDNTTFIGFSTQNTAFGDTASVAISGPLEGFSGLVTGSEYYLSLYGLLETTISSTNIKVGVAKSSTELFIYSNSTLDIYGITHNKIEYNDLSIGSNNEPEGEGGITYNSSTGEFSYTPALVSTLNNLNLTGIPTAPTASSDTSNAQIATTAFVNTAASYLASYLAPVFSPSFTGVPTAPTAAVSTNNTQIATTAFVNTQIANTASTDSPNFTGVPTAPTAAVGTNTTQIATTAFVLSNGGGLNIDGGLAVTVRNTSTITLNGGGA